MQPIEPQNHQISFTPFAYMIQLYDPDLMYDPDEILIYVKTPVK
jgi:hypothetical protein